jgi:hypothetical protein
MFGGAAVAVTVPAAEESPSATVELGTLKEGFLESLSIYKSKILNFIFLNDL